MSIGHAEDNTEILVDVSSIKISSNTRNAWIKQVYKRSGESSHVKAPTETVGLMEFNCNDALVRPKYATDYFADGTTKSASAMEHPREWAPVEPDTVQEAEFKFVCSWKPK